MTLTNQWRRDILECHCCLFYLPCTCLSGIGNTCFATWKWVSRVAADSHSNTQGSRTFADANFLAGPEKMALAWLVVVLTLQTLIRQTSYCKLTFSRATISQATATNGLGLANEIPFKENKKSFFPKRYISWRKNPTEDFKLAGNGSKYHFILGIMFSNLHDSMSLF